MKTQFFSEVARKHTEDDAEKVVICGAPGTIPDPATLSSECPRPWLYTRVLAFFVLVTALLFLATAILNQGAISNVLVVGALAVPFTILTLFFEFNVYQSLLYLKRQVRMRGEGSAFGIPGAQLIAQGVLYHRLRRGGMRRSFPRVHGFLTRTSRPLGSRLYWMPGGRSCGN